MKSRTLDAMRATHFIPYETWEVQPYNLIGRLKKRVADLRYSQITTLLYTV